MNYTMIELFQPKSNESFSCFKYYIKALKVTRDSDIMEILFESAKDVLYSKTFQEEGKPIEVNVDKHGHLMLRIDYRELNSVQAFDDTIWNLIKSEWDKKEEISNDYNNIL